jgi:hypothetical protein
VAWRVTATSHCDSEDVTAAIIVYYVILRGPAGGLGTVTVR